MVNGKRAHEGDRRTKGLWEPKPFDIIVAKS